jgi:hypothetical protein
MTAAPTLAIRSPAASLFHTATGTAFIDIVIEGHRETWPIRGKQVRAWLRRAGTHGPRPRRRARRSHLFGPRRQGVACSRTYARRMAGHRLSAGEIQTCRRDVAAANAAEGRIDRRTCAVTQSFNTKRSRVDGGAALGNAAAERPLSVIVGGR